MYDISFMRSVAGGAQAVKPTQRLKSEATEGASYTQPLNRAQLAKQLGFLSSQHLEVLRTSQSQ